MMEFEEPTVREHALPYAAFVWSSHTALALPLPAVAVAYAPRRSERTLAPPTLAQLSALLWHTARCRESLPGPEGFALHSRPVPSAGAIHPIHVLCELPDRSAWGRYDPFAHKLDLLPKGLGLSRVRTSAVDFLGSTQGSLLAFVRNPG